jgi:ElaB/YqjD/DUF883 family membrane-anchored ribosome-binding protein
VSYLLLIGGFLAAAYSTALDTQMTNWNLFVPAAIVAIVGVFIIKRRARGDARSESVLTANRTELSESLSNIVRDLEQIISDSASMSTTELRNAIDDKLRNDLRRFADARESMVHLYGLQTYADIMSDFAAGERYVNRVWSAAARPRLPRIFTRRRRNSRMRRRGWKRPAEQPLLCEVQVCKGVHGEREANWRSC